jgi:class 3 adenylate cyclase
MTLAAGATARIKRIVVAGDAAAIAARLEKLASD